MKNCWIVIGLSLIITSCGPGDPFGYVQVSGKVTYEDDSLIPAHRIAVMFNPQAAPLDPKTYPRPGMAEVNGTDGSFDTVTSHKYGDGIVPGKHTVLIRAFDEQDQQIYVVPSEYSDAATTPLEIDTDQTTIFNFKVKKP